MKKILLILPVLLLALVACNDKGNGNNPLDNTNKNRNKDNNDRDNNDRVNKERDDDDDDDNDEEDVDDSQGSVTGTWRMVDFEAEDGEEMTEEIMEMMRSSRIKFNRDGSYSATSLDPEGESRTETGTYTYNARSKTLETVEDKNGQRETVEVEFRGKRMYLTSPEGRIIMERQ